MSKTAIVIGSGFSGLSAASFLAKAGWKTIILEKHGTPGGRARQLEAHGFRFDMGPSWYWMPDVFEHFFSCFGKSVSECYELVRLDPSYRVVWADGFTDIPAGTEKVRELFESWEPGAGLKLDMFLKEARYKYDTGMKHLVYKPGLHIREFVDASVISGMFRLDIFSSIRQHVARYFKQEKIRRLLEFPVLFLGALPAKTPALYSLMNYADISGGTWFPMGGMFRIVEAMVAVATTCGVEFNFNSEVTGFEIQNNRITGVHHNQGTHKADLVVASADYHFVEQHLLPLEYRSHSERYWSSRQMAPSCLLFYVGVNKKLKNVVHHMLFFDHDFEAHGQEIYVTKSWPREPLFYVSVTSVTDTTVAPPGCENLFFLIPVAAGLDGDDETLREKYFTMIVNRFEKHTGERISDSIVYKKSFGVSDFTNEYHSFLGNAYGLANTLRQTAVLKPECRSSKIKNLYYTGQLTVPGPGVPPSLISGEVVAKLANATLQTEFA